MIVDPQSFRGLAYEVLNMLTSSAANDDNKLTLPLIEADLRKQYAILLKEEDKARERTGNDPESYRLQTIRRNVDGVGLNRKTDVPGMLTYNGKTYISYAGLIDAEVSFVPCDYRWQLPGIAQVNNKPSFCVEGQTLYLRLTERTVLVDEIDITGIPSMPFPDLDRSDEWFWKKPWNVPEDIKGKIKLQTMRVFMGTHIQLAPRTDTKNNGLPG